MNAYEMQARCKKVDRLMETIRAAGITLEDALKAEQDDWAMLASAAGVNLPSIITRELIIARLREEGIQADRKAEAEWEERQSLETGADRCPPRE